MSVLKYQELENFNSAGAFSLYAKALHRTQYPECVDSDLIVHLLKCAIDCSDDQYIRTSNVSDLVNFVAHYQSPKIAIDLLYEYFDSSLLSRSTKYAGLVLDSKIHTALPICDEHDIAWSLSGTNELQKFIIDKMSNGVAASLVRFADGESLVLTRASPTFLGISSTKYNGDALIDQNDYDFLHASLVSSIKNADVLGLPTLKQTLLNSQFETVINSISEHEIDIYSDNYIVRSCMFHYHLFWSGSLSNILRSTNFVGYIGTHDIDNYLADHGVINIQKHIIPGESMYNLHIGDVPHYPDHFNDIDKKLKVPFKGALYIVGAGVLGKIYCDLIKKRGGVGLDIGAVMDLIAGNKFTRITTRNSATRGFLSTGAHL